MGCHLGLSGTFFTLGPQSQGPRHDSGNSQPQEMTGSGPDWPSILSISVLVMVLLRFSISSWSSFGKLYFSKNLSISSTLSILSSHLNHCRPLSFLPSIPPTIC